MKLLQTGLAVLLLCFAAGAPLAADSPQTGTLEGRVEDAQGEPLPGVTVILRSGRGEQSTTTDADGFYRVGLLPPDTYIVEAGLEGLESQSSSVRIDTGQRRRLDLRLGLTETIAVVAETPLINKYDVGTTASVEADVVEELVFSSRNYQSVSTLMPGAAHNGSSLLAAETRVTYNGTLWRENLVFIDGVDVSITRSAGSSRLLLPSSALTEIRADGGGYGAEYGRTSGGISSVVTKSGTNQFHGDFLYVAQNPKWRAESKPFDIPREDELNSSFEASVGGPIKRDNAWFFLARGETTTNETELLRDGSLVDASLHTEPLIGKLNGQAGAHSLSGTYVEIPTTKDIPTPATGDIYAVPAFDLGGDFFTVTWNWAIGASEFLELRAADQNQTSDRRSLTRRELDSTKSPHTPLNNGGVWLDQAAAARYNFVADATGEAFEDFPRQQANAAFTWFLGDDHEIKLGADYQDISWETLNYLPAEFRGAGFNLNAPGGFNSPLVMRVFVPAQSPIVQESTNSALFAQDRLALGDHWSVTLGARIEEQVHDNDVGRETSSATDVSPRLAAVYDVRADGRLLVKATLGRYYQQIPEEGLSAFVVKPSGVNEFDEFGWNAATQLYDRFLRHVSPTSSPVVAPDLDPYYKDEAIAGVEWQLNDAWAFEARGIWWEYGDLYWLTEQIAADRSIFRELVNRDQGEREYLGLQLELNRRFRGGWVLRSNYTLSEQEGNVFGDVGAVSGEGSAINDDFLEARSVINPATGLPYTATNRFGGGPQDRTHVLNLSGAKEWQVGRHGFSLGGFFWYRTGEPWGQKSFVIFSPTPAASPFTVVVVPGLRGTIQSDLFIEPRGDNELPETMSLSLTGAWNFPLGSRVEGNLRLEVTNVTDEQDQILINLLTGQALPLRAGYTFPREIRAVAGVRF